MLNVEIVGTFAQNPESSVLGRRPYEVHVANKPPSRSMPLPSVRSARSYSAPIVVGRGCCGERVAAEHQDALPASGVVDEPPGSGSVLMCSPLRSRERFLCQEGNGTIHQSVSWMWKAKTHVFGCVDVAPGRRSYWTPGRKNSEGMSWKA
jgi:hypothetical protein